MNQSAVRERIKSSAEYYWSADTLGEYKYGAGKINAYRAITVWGEITADTTWNATDTNDSTFYVSGDLVIADGKTLTINAGTKIKIAPDNEQNMALGVDSARVEIIVEGSLIIAGTANNPVVFESFTDAASDAGDWHGIRIASSADTVSLSYCEIRHAKWGVDIWADDVTDIVRGWLEVPSTNHGVAIGALIGAPDGRFTVNSGALGTGVAARLVVYYESP